MTPFPAPKTAPKNIIHKYLLKLFITKDFLLIYMPRVKQFLTIFLLQVFFLNSTKNLKRKPVLLSSPRLKTSLIFQHSFFSQIYRHSQNCFPLFQPNFLSQAFCRKILTLAISSNYHSLYSYFLSISLNFLLFLSMLYHLYVM